jgi:hypothetical protein
MRNFLKTKFNRIKNTFKKPSKKAFGKIGLFLVLGIIFLNLNFSAVRMDTTIFNVASAVDPNSTSLLTVLFNKLNAIGLFPNKDNIAGINQINAVGKVLDTNPFSLIFKLLLLALVEALAVMVSTAGLLLDLTIDQDFFRALIDNEGLYQGWVIVRDLLNMFFMLLLLFSAFATIFQVEKYHLRKMIIMLVVMALLVNFSFPVTRFVIDFSNSAMYFLAERLTGSAIIGEFTNLGGVLKASSDYGSDISALILNCIFLFIIFCTIFAIGINLLIRILAFALLIVVSPVGFAFAFFPGTKNIADDWWSALFKYAFLGPVMMFFLYLAVLMFKINTNADYGKLEGSLPGNFVTFIVPIAFLWMGLIASQKFGGSGSAAAMSFAKSTGNKIKTYGQKAAWGAAVATGVPGTASMAWKHWNKHGFPGGLKNVPGLGGVDKRQEREKRWATRLGAGSSVIQDINQKASKLVSDGIDEDQLRSDLVASGGLNMNAATALALKGDLSKADYERVRAQYNSGAINDNVFNDFNQKVKKKRVDLFISGQVDREIRNPNNANHAAAVADRVAREQSLMTARLGKLDARGFAEMDWHQIFDTDPAVSMNTPSFRANMATALDTRLTSMPREVKAEIRKTINGQRLDGITNNVTPGQL